MKVICEKCRGRYRVPDSKLNKPVNRATCRNCGHRLLIPRPTGNEPAEGVLVQAVPATPRPAPSRGDIQPMGLARAPRAPARTMPPSALSWEEAPSAAVTQRRPPPGSGSRGPVPSRATPAPDMRRSAAPSDPRIAVPSGTGHDPAGDMGLAMFGTGATLLGALLLSLLSLISHDGLIWAGLALAFGGTVLTIMLMVTGQRGRRPARRTLSLTMGLATALMIPSALVGAKVGVEQMIGGDIQFDVGDIVVSPPPVVAPLLAGADSGDGGLEPRVGVGGPAEPADVPPADPVARAPSPAEAAEPTVGAAPPTAPAAVVVAPEPARAAPPVDDSAPSALHIQAVETMLRNNLGVKQCFVPLHRAGSLPRRVEVKFNILPDGTAAGVQIESPAQHRESSLQKCIAKAIPAIRFPETSGKGTTITYPFILQMR